MRAGLEGGGARRKRALVSRGEGVKDMKYPSSCCQKCGAGIGWLGRFFQFVRVPIHKCRREVPRTMPETAPCLHCEILKLMQRATDRQHLSANEVAFKVTEALADLIAGIGSREGRRQMTQSVEEELHRMTKHYVQARQASGLPPYEEHLIQ